MPLKYWISPAAPLGACVFAALLVSAMVRFVDLSPKVEGDFFFADDDPQMQASQSVAEQFPVGAQIILRVTALGGTREDYIERVGALTSELLVVPGVDGGFSLTTDDPSRSPLFRRILLTPDSAASNIVLLVDGSDPESLLPRIEEIVSRHEIQDFSVVVSGVPVIVELIRRSLYRDLIVFSSAAVLVFALLIAIVFRDPAIVIGTLATCFTSVAGTLLLVEAMNVGIGLLTANLVTIVFVLTLSHVVFLTANWRRRSGERIGGDSAAEGRIAALSTAVRDTWEGSFWSMTTTLLGFASLLVATARPLRELGIAGSVGAATALVVAYAIFPAFLARWARPAARHASFAPVKLRAGTRYILPLAALLVVVFGTGVSRIDTDPSLLSYFAEGSTIREGLAQIDADGGSSTLDLVVADPGGSSVSDGSVYRRLEVLQATLEADSAVGVVLSPTVLIDHARTIPLAGLLPVDLLLDLASSDALDNVALGYVSRDRDVARFSLRMRESSATPREDVIARLRSQVEAAGLHPVVVAGLYDLQAQLGRMIRSSLKIGIGGLLILFLGVAFVVSRSLRTAALMWTCLATIPIVILGAFGHARLAIDIIASPAANIALAIGADSMIHLVLRVRALAAAGVDTPWPVAVTQIGRPVLGASAIIIAGFGIFALSSFPPTQRFGMAVIVGTVTAACMALLVLPHLACLGRRPIESLSASAS